MHLRAQDALQVCSGVWKDRWVPIDIKASTTDPCDSRRHRGFSWSHAMNSSNDSCRCEDDVVSSAHGTVVENEVVPAALHPHADCLLAQSLEGPLTVPPFANGSVCSRFTHPHMANRSMVRNVAGVRGRALWVVVDSTSATMAAREHHDCDGIAGVELQNDDGEGRTLESHRSQRHARDEWMAPIGCAVYCTEITLAASADLGCMRVNWDMA
ncbi:surface protease GP63 [Trypanosoma cruzi]|nr:surface protease GP63 [Trypanosoma cruzi]